MDVVFDYLFDILLNGALETVKDRRISKPVRILILALVTLIYLSLMVIFTCAAFRVKNNLARIGFVLINLTLICLMCKLYYSIIKARRMKI